MATTTLTNQSPQKRGFLQNHKLKLAVILVLILIAMGSVALALGFTVHHKDIPDDYWTTTSVLKHKLLDTEVFIGALTMILLVTICLALWGYWKLHCLPKKYAAHTGQTKLIFWLCTLGFFYNWLWIAAALIVVTDWDKIYSFIQGRDK